MVQFCYFKAMQKPSTTQPELFVTSADLEHRSFHGLDGAETVLGWKKLKPLWQEFTLARPVA